MSSPAKGPYRAVGRFVYDSLDRQIAIVPTGFDGLDIEEARATARLLAESWNLKCEFESAFVEYDIKTQSALLSQNQNLVHANERIREMEYALNTVKPLLVNAKGYTTSDRKQRALNIVRRALKAAGEE